MVILAVMAGALKKNNYKLKINNMNVYIFEHIDKLTQNYHNEGGLVIIAKDKKSAKKLINTNTHIEVTAKEWENVIIYSVNATEEKLYIFPDAGCC